MPLPTFSRKASSASQRGSEPASHSQSSKDTQDTLVLPSRHPGISRSGSTYSIKSFRSSTSPNAAVKASDLLAGFQGKHVIPASRRFASFSGESASLRSPSALEMQASAGSSRTTSLRSSASIIGNHAVHSHSNLAETNLHADELLANKAKSRTVSGPAMMPHSDNEKAPESGLDSESDGDEQAFESPDDFSDSEQFSSNALPSRKASSITAKPPPSETPVKASTSAVSYSEPDPSETPLRADIRQIWYAVSLFMNSRMVDAETIMLKRRHDRLYYSLGYSLITSIKALMTFEPTDLGAAIEHCRGTLDFATREKNRIAPGQRGMSWSEKVTGSVGGVFKGSSLSVEGAERMTTEQRHAELAYAECLLLKAILGIIYAGDFLAFIKEALNMRSSYATYRTFSRFVAIRDSKHSSGHDSTLDQDFRSGVAFGNGNISLILSLLPSSATKVMDLFGFSGNRRDALNTLMNVGGWVSGQAEPNVIPGPGTEGLRRCVCDLTLLMYHLIISSIIPMTDVDVDLADKILHYNLRRYPQGVFFLYFSGRLYSTQTRGPKAVEQYHKAINSQKDYVQIQHICHWDLSLTHLSLADYEGAYECLDVLEKESNWSKASYAYGKAVTLYECTMQSLNGKNSSSSDDLDEVRDKQKKVKEIMATIPDFMQKIAGKSLPFEKFVARKSKKFLAQNDYLALPGIELAYMLYALNLAPRYALYDKHLDQVSEKISELQAKKEGEGLPDGWWDDFCLAHFLRGVILHLIARPEPHVVADPAELPIPVKEADQQALLSFGIILTNSTKIELDHQIVWFAHYEYGRLLMAMGEEHYSQAKEQFAIVLENRVQLGPTKGKGKVSLQNVVVLRANASMDQLKAKMNG